MMNSATPGSVPATAGNVAFIRGYVIESLEAQSRARAVIVCRIGDEFEAVVRLFLQYSARAVICGMGKSGLVGKKIAATLASAGENDPCRPVDVVEIFGR
jgi:hypothetical protein